MALKKVRGTMERMFDKNLTDLVRGIRNNKDNEVSKIIIILPTLNNVEFVYSSSFTVHCD